VAWEVVLKRSLGILTLFALAFAQAQPAAFAASKDKDKPARPVGHVVQAASALVDRTTLNVGTTLYNGDTIYTDIEGSMHASVRSSLVAMPASSSVTLEECTDELHVLVNQGTVVFTASPADHMELIIAQGIVRPADGQSASGQISIVSPREAIVSATHGSLVVDDDGNQQTIPEGKTYKITMGGDPRDYAPASGCAGGDQNSKMVHPRSRNLLFDLIIAGAAAGAGYGIWQLDTVSPSKP
jgi:hypothetical protein